MFETTIKNPVSITGISLRDGDLCTVKLSPSDNLTGIRFFTINSGKAETINCNPLSVIDTMCSTNIGIVDISISTIEHLMSVLHVCNIHNVDITVSGSGIPILDGSSKSLFYLIKSAGIKYFEKKCKYILIDKELSIKSDCASIKAFPYDGFKVLMSIKFNHPLIGEQSFLYDHKINYLEEIAPARTFARLDDIKKLQQLGVINGGSEDNAIILDDNKVINTELYWCDEFVRHKVLDFLGDIYMLGPIKGYFKCCCTGHDTNIKMLNIIMDNIK